MVALIVDQHLDPLAYAPALTQADPVPGIILPRSKWRVIGPSQPSRLRICDACGDTHQIDGKPIYTSGCLPAAVPAGSLYTDGNATFAVPDNAHPVGFDVANCPEGGRAIPHLHSPSDYRWVD